MDVSVIASALSPLLASALTWALVKRSRDASDAKTSAESEAVHIRNIEGYALLWKKTADEINNNQKKIMEENKELQRSMYELVELEEECSKKLLSISQQNVELRNELLFIKKMKNDKE